MGTDCLTRATGSALGCVWERRRRAGGRVDEDDVDTVGESADGGSMPTDATRRDGLWSDSRLEEVRGRAAALFAVGDAGAGVVACVEAGPDAATALVSLRVSAGLDVLSSAGAADPPRPPPLRTPLPPPLPPRGAIFALLTPRNAEPESLLRPQSPRGAEVDLGAHVDAPLPLGATGGMAAIGRMRYLTGLQYVYVG